MPYILQDERDEHDEWLDALIQGLEEDGFRAGTVTYAIYKIVACWFKSEPCYETICKIRGVLAGVLSEFDRQFAFPYEDEKIKANGDVDLGSSMLANMNINSIRMGIDPDCDMDCCKPWQHEGDDGGACDCGDCKPASCNEPVDIDNRGGA